MKKIVLAAAAVLALSAPAFAQTTAPGTAEHKATPPGNGTMSKGDKVPATGHNVADDNKQTATGGQPGGSALTGR